MKFLQHTLSFSPSQKFPDTLLPPTYPDSDNPGHLLARSEVERRTDYIQLLYEQLGKQHLLSQLVSQCLHNIPAQRPSAEDLLQQLETVRSQIEEAYGSQHVNVEIARLQVTMMSVLRTKDAKAAESDRQQRELLQTLRVRIHEHLVGGGKLSSFCKSRALQYHLLQVQAEEPVDLIRGF